VEDGPSPLTKIAGLGLGAALLLALMYLFSLTTVTDTGASATARTIDDALAPMLDPSQPTRITMTREGTGTKPPRRYVVRLSPSEAVAADPRRTAALCRKAQTLVLTSLDGVEAQVTVDCVVEGRAHFAWRRSDESDGHRLEELLPPPPLPNETAEASASR
jgi:hypothetical protein